jgi:hypothetical protein
MCTNRWEQTATRDWTLLKADYGNCCIRVKPMAQKSVHCPPKLILNECNIAISVWCKSSKCVELPAMLVLITAAQRSVLQL